MVNPPGMADETEPPDPESDALIARLRSGDPDAFRQIDLMYARRLIGLARKRLPSRVSARVDAEDIVQSVLRTFFTRVVKGEFQALQDPEGCWRILATITRRKCGRRVLHHMAGRRNVGREADDSATWEAVARGPSPEEAAVVIETIETLSREFEPHQVRMLGLLLEGRSAAETAEEVGCSKRTTERFRESLQKKLRAMLDDDPAAASSSRP